MRFFQCVFDLMNYWLKGQTLSKGLDVGHIQIQTTFYKIRVKNCSLF
jgi:hypothetical protein